jgi:hypothetical protein
MPPMRGPMRGMLVASGPCAHTMQWFFPPLQVAGFSAVLSCSSTYGWLNAVDGVEEVEDRISHSPSSSRCVSYTRPRPQGCLSSAVT